MPYTPPGGGSISVDLGLSAYTPPSGGAISVDLDADDGGGSTQSNAVGTGALVVTGHADILAVSTLVSTISAAGTLTVTANPPASYSITKVSAVGVGALTVTAHIPTFLSVKSTQVDVTAGLAVQGHSPASYFKGKINLVGTGAVAVEAHLPASVTHKQILSVGGQVTVVGHVPRFVWGTQLDSSGSVTVTAHADITQRFSVRAGILSKYSYPSITLTDHGQLVVTAHSGISQKFVLHAGVEAVYDFAQVVYGCIQSSYNYRLVGSVSSSYNINSPVVDSVSSSYDVRSVDTVTKQVTAPYRMPIGASVLSPYSAPAQVRVSASVDSTYTLIEHVKVGASVTDTYTLIEHVKVRQGIPSTYSMPVPSMVSNSVRGVYAYQLISAVGVTSSYNMTSPVRKGTTFLYTSMVNTPVKKSVTGVYTSHVEGALLINTGPFATVNGLVVPLENLQVSISEGEFMWKCSMVLTNIADYMNFTKDAPFTVDIGGEVYSFIMDTKELSRRSPANISAIVSGLSPSALYTEPRSAMLEQSWDTPVMAATAAQSIIPGLDWQVIDWLIPEYRLAASGVSPYSIVSVIASAVGATVETDIDGSIYVRSLYPTPVTDYYTVLADHTILETDHIFSVSETYPSDRIYNRIVISDVEDQISDSLEWIPAYEGAWVGVVRAYLYPWRTGVWLTHTGRATNYILPPAVVLEEYTEVIEVYQGKGSAAHPIFSITSVEYEANNVGALTVSPDSSEFTVTAANPNTVIRLVYRSRSLDYPVGIVEGAPTQFLLNSQPL